MTYCLGIKLDQSIIMMSDSRTSAGVDNISTYSKMWRFGVPGERQFVLCSAGNLATTQTVIAHLERDCKNPEAKSLLTITDLHEAAEYIGELSVEAQNKAGGGPVYETTFIFCGEILGSDSGLYMIYPQGNFIASSSQVPFLQIGEAKYGKPILDRVIEENMPLERALVCSLISMDATMRSNLTVGPPVELCVMQRGTLNPASYRSLGPDDDYMRNLQKLWNDAMKNAIDGMPKLVLE